MQPLLRHLREGGLDPVAMPGTQCGAPLSTRTRNDAPSHAIPSHPRAGVTAVDFATYEAASAGNDDPHHSGSDFISCFFFLNLKLSMHREQVNAQARRPETRLSIHTCRSGSDAYEAGRRNASGGRRDGGRRVAGVRHQEGQAQAQGQRRKGRWQGGDLGEPQGVSVNGPSKYSYRSNRGAECGRDALLNIGGHIES